MHHEQVPHDIARLLLPRNAFADGDGEIDDIIVDDAHDQLMNELDDVADDDGRIEDPGLAALHLTKQRFKAAEADRRLLIAYLREFLHRPYSAATVAVFAGMSASNVRKGKAYGDEDIATVSRLLHRPLPGPSDDPELAAMSHLDRIIGSLPPDERAKALSNTASSQLRNEDLAAHDLTDDVWHRVLTWARSRYLAKTTT